MKRSQRQGPPKPARKEDTKPIERHSGEGSASVLEMLQKMEKRQLPEKPPEPGT